MKLGIINQTNSYTNHLQMKLINYKSQRILCMSNTHGRHRSLIIPKADIVIHAGGSRLLGKCSQDQRISAGTFYYQHS